MTSSDGRTTPTRRPSIAARRVGYVIGALVSVALLYLVNVWPGWQAVPVLTEDTRQVLGVVNLSFVFGLVTNVLYVAHDARWWRALGEVVSTGIALVVLIRVWLVFPFEFAAGPVDWALLEHRNSG